MLDNQHKARDPLSVCEEEGTQFISFITIFVWNKMPCWTILSLSQLHLNQNDRNIERLQVTSRYIQSE